MKSVRFIFAVVAVIATIYFGYGYIKIDANEPWTKQEVIKPKELMKVLGNKNALQPLILNIGFAGNIKNAVEIGAANDVAGIEKLKNKLQNVPRNKLIVFYCGCCPYNHCPNVRPAFKLLKEMQFSNFKLLDLPENLKVNWINEGGEMAAK